MGCKVLLAGKLMFPSDYVSAVEFKGRDVTLTIKSVTVENLKLRGGTSERKPVVHFAETKKRLVLNKTNADSIAQEHGTDADKWLGKKITLYPTKTQCGRDMVDCIRVREPKGRRPQQVDAPHAAIDDNDPFPIPPGDAGSDQGEPVADPTVLDELSPHDECVELLCRMCDCTSEPAIEVLNRKSRPLGYERFADLPAEKLASIRTRIQTGDIRVEPEPATT